MPKYRLPEMSIAQMQYTPTTFQGVSFTPQAPDMNILARSLAQAEERQNKASEKKSEIDKTLAGLETKLHNDKETQQWFANYKDNIERQIQDEVNSGNYGSAIRVATGLAGSIPKDPAIQGRIRAEESYQKEIKTQQERRDRKEISQNTYDWWLASNPYKYQDNYDSEGNIIGGTEYVAESRPVADINWAAQAQAAFQMITPYKKTKAKRPSTLGDVTNIKSSTLKGYSNEEQSISKQDILDNIETLLSSTSDGYRQGGLGPGVTILNGSYWSYYNNYNPITPCGYCNEIGNNTGVKSMTIITPTSSGGDPTQTYNLQVPRWRGFDNPFGDIWTNLDGIVIHRTASS